jgi:hypothetical protein
MMQKEQDRLHDKQERIKENQDQFQDEQIGCGEHFRLKEEQDQL